MKKTSIALLLMAGALPTFYTQAQEQPAKLPPPLRIVKPVVHQLSFSQIFSVADSKVVPRYRVVIGGKEYESGRKIVLLDSRKSEITQLAQRDFKVITIAGGYKILGYIDKQGS